MKLLTFLFFLFICRFCNSYEYFLSNASGKVEKENFTYYSMYYEGTILLELSSLSGDCDLYVSQTLKKPGYLPQQNCLQSTTCGLDSVIIPKSFKRPIGIGIFGHPSHEDCTYNLGFFRINDSRDIFNYNPYQESVGSEPQKKLKETQETKASDPEDESLFWVFLRSAVIFLLEVIL